MLFYQLLIISIQRKVQFKSIRSFIGAKNFDTSKEFYKELGFIEVSLGEKMSYFRIDNNLGFYLQDYYTKKWINNSMLFLEVDDLQTYLQEMKAKNLPSKYKNVKLSEIIDKDWGSEFFLHDPSGILWHFGNFKN